MRQGDGSDFLDAGDPRISEIGVIYVEAQDSRPEILTTINILNMQGRKQIVIVLPEQRKVFRESFDFDGLKQARRDLKAQVIVVSPFDANAAELARQRKFPAYSSLESLKHTLLIQGMPTQQNVTQKPSLLAFGSRKARAGRVQPATIVQQPPAQSSQSPAAGPSTMPPTPRMQPSAVPPTPQQQGSPLSPLPPTPRRTTPDNSPVPPTPRFPAQPISPLPPTPVNKPKNPPGLRAEDDETDKTLIKKPGSLGEPPAMPVKKPRANTPGKLAPGEPPQTGPGIIAFPGVSLPPRASGKMPAAPNQGQQPTTQGKGSGKLSAMPPAQGTPTPRASSKMPAAPNQGKLASAQAPAPQNAPFGPVQPSAQAAQPKRDSGKIPAARQPGPLGGAPALAPGALPPAQGVSSMPSTRLDAVQVQQSAPFGPVQPAAQPNRDSAKMPAVRQPNPLGGAPALTAGALAAGAAAPGAPAVYGPVAPAAAARGTAAPGAPAAAARGTAAPVATAHPAMGASPGAPAPAGPAGPRAGARPSGLAPLPPPRPRYKLFTWRRGLLAALLAILLGGLAFTLYNNKGLPNLGGIFAGTTTATVTITPASKLEQNNYIITGLPNGTTNPATRQVQAQNLSITSEVKSATGGATGSISPTRATGTLRFINNNNAPVTIASTPITGNDGVQVSFNGPITVPTAGTFDASAFAVNPGNAGNIPAFDVSRSCCVGGITVKNLAAFTGGHDAVPNSVIQQSDIDGAAKPLIDTLSVSTKQALQAEVKGNERVLDGSANCSPTTTADQKVGDQVKQVHVNVSVTCKEEVYDFAAGQQMAVNLLSGQAQQDQILKNAPYALDGQIMANVLNASLVSADGQITLEYQARGLWVYQFTQQMLQNIKQRIVKIKQSEALDILQHWPGVASAKVDLSSGSTMPDNPNNIALSLQSLPGATLPEPGTGPGGSNPSGSGSGTPGPGTPNPSNPGPGAGTPGGSNSLFPGSGTPGGLGSPGAPGPGTPGSGTPGSGGSGGPGSSGGSGTPGSGGPAPRPTPTPVSGLGGS